MSSHHTCCTKQKVKRGLWSPDEDEKLIKYVSKYGHGCWSTVPRLAGLQRCGKSCRLRWINYLRPDLKRGNFNTHEANLIIELHRLIGNRWAQIAKHLPGRTDNEVKNFWNSSIKRKLNLELEDETASSSDQSPPPSHSPQNLYLVHPTINNNLQIPNPQIHHQINPNYQTPQYLGFDLDQMMNYDPNFALMPPPSIHVPPDPSWTNFPPSPTFFNPDETFMFGYDNPNPNPNPNSNPGFFDQDSAMFDAFMPELDEISIWDDDFGVFASSEPLFEATQFSGFSNGVESPSPPLHPNHIDNIAALMTKFAPPPPPQAASGGAFVVNPSFPSASWGPQQP